MFSAMYQAASGMQQATSDYETISFNLANIGTSGFRRLVNQHATQASNSNPTDNTRTTSGDLTGVDLAQGRLIQTGNPLDIALEGPGFIELAGSNGPIFTRDGQLSLTADGTLVSRLGIPVQGENGPISIPAGLPVEDILIGRDGQVVAGGIPVGRISIKEALAPDAVTHAGDGTYLLDENRTVSAVNTTIYQGMREDSNVNPLREMVRMIEAMRRYEAAQKTITSINEATRKNTDV